MVTYNSGMRWYRRFKKRHKVTHLVIVAVAVVMMWRGIWSLLDLYLLPDQQLLSNVLSIAVAFAILYFDDFHLKELS